MKNKKMIIKKIPTSQTSDLNARADGVDYLYTNRLIKGKYVFINVMTDRADPIMIITNMPIFNYVTYDLFEFYPNPTTEQLINVPGDILRLAFPGSNSIMVDIVTLYGHAEISWKSDPDTKFVLRGVGDRISLYSGKEIDELVVHRLVTDKVNSNEKGNNLSAMENPGFVFYIRYHLVNPENEISYEEINYGKINNMNNIRNNYGISMNNKNFRNYQLNEDINNNYYSKENYGNNEDRMVNNKRGYNDGTRQGKNFNENFNDSNPISNNFYK